MDKITKIKSGKEDEARILNALSTIVSKTSDLSSSIFALNHEKIN